MDFSDFHHAIYKARLNGLSDKPNGDGIVRLTIDEAESLRAKHLEAVEALNKIENLVTHRLNN